MHIVVCNLSQEIGSCKFQDRCADYLVIIPMLFLYARRTNSFIPLLASKLTGTVVYCSKVPNCPVDSVGLVPAILCLPDRVMSEMSHPATKREVLHLCIKLVGTSSWPPLGTVGCVSNQQTNQLPAWWGLVFIYMQKDGGVQGVIHSDVPS